MAAVPGSWGEFIGFKGSVEKDDNMMQQPVWFVIVYTMLVLLMLVIFGVMIESDGKDIKPRPLPLCALIAISGGLLSVLSVLFILTQSRTTPRPAYAYLSLTALLSLIALFLALCCFAWISFRLLDDSDAYFDAKLEMILQGGEMAVEG